MTVIDAHHHLWDPARAHYPWLNDSLPSINRPMEYDEFEPLIDAAGVDKTVLVQSSDVAEDTEYMLEQASLHPRIAAVVGWVPLDRPVEAERRLEKLVEHPAFRGIRAGINFEPDADWLLRDDVTEGLRVLAAAEIPFDIVSVRRRHLELVPELSARHPTLRMVIDHLSKPPVKKETWEPWRANLSLAARNPLVEFGADRLMIGSDWPIANLAGGYTRVWDALTSIADALSPDERTAILGGTAARFYSIQD
jgi:L-fuconolactonase